MIYLALTALALAAFTVWVAFAFIRGQAREQWRERQTWAAERRELNDRLAHMADRPWTPPPIRERRPEPEPLPEFADLDNEPV